VFWLGGGFLMQNVYAFVLHQFPSVDGTYAIEGHKLAVGIIALFLAAAIVWFFVATVLINKKAKRLPADN
jgi:hypothetical protein